MPDRLISPPEPVVDEDPEAVSGAELTLSLAGAAAGREHPPVLYGVGVAVEPGGLPLEEPIGTPAAHLPPLLEVVNGERAQHDPAPGEREGAGPYHHTSLVASSIGAWYGERVEPCAVTVAARAKSRTRVAPNDHT